jgi:hypothetical protein
MVLKELNGVFQFEVVAEVSERSFLPHVVAAAAAVDVVSVVVALVVYVFAVVVVFALGVVFALVVSVFVAVVVVVALVVFAVVSDQVVDAAISLEVVVVFEAAVDFDFVSVEVCLPAVVWGEGVLALGEACPCPFGDR